MSITSSNTNSTEVIEKPIFVSSGTVSFKAFKLPATDSRNLLGNGFRFNLADVRVTGTPKGKDLELCKALQEFAPEIFLLPGTFRLGKAR
jgi:hypothetical protein